MTATLNRVEITREAHGLIVRPFYDGVDRAAGGGLSLNDTPSHMALAKRLKAAIEAGVAYPIRGIRTDVNGRTYADTELRVLGRTLNADLRRLGF